MSDRLPAPSVVLFPLTFLLVGFFPGIAFSQGVSDSTFVTITGTVVDFTTLDPIPGVEIAFPDLDLVYVSDSSGGFVFEDIPLGLHEMKLEKDGYIPVQGPLTVSKSGSFAVQLRPEGSLEPGTLSGRVVDPESGLPVETAMVGLHGTGLQRMTNAEGRFGFVELSPGQYLLEVKHVGHAPRSDSVRVVSGRITEVEIPLAVRPIEMEPITVRAQSKWMEKNRFYQRMAGDYRGKQWTAEEIQESGVTHLGDLLEEVEGIRVAWRGTGGLSILYPPERDMRRWCSMPTPNRRNPLDQYGPRHGHSWRVEGLEVYHGIDAPAEYSYDYPCGVILVWTRVGTGDLQT